MAPGRKTGGGSRKGKPNKLTSTAREAWGVAWEVTAPKVAGWLDSVAQGKPEDDDGPARAPDPAKAAELAIRMAEYHVPKLAQQALTGGDGGPLTVVVQSLAEVGDGQAQAGGGDPGAGDD